VGVGNIFGKRARQFLGLQFSTLFPAQRRKLSLLRIPRLLDINTRSRNNNAQRRTWNPVIAAPVLTDDRTRILASILAIFSALREASVTSYSVVPSLMSMMAGRVYGAERLERMMHCREDQPVPKRKLGRGRTSGCGSAPELSLMDSGDWTFNVP
jgi:hypothetical protein